MARHHSRCLAYSGEACFPALRLGGAPTHVTSNAGGDLAPYTPSELGLVTTADLAGFATKGDVAALQTQINHLGQRDKELTEGPSASPWKTVAIILAVLLIAALVVNALIGFEMTDVSFSLYPSFLFSFVFLYLVFAGAGPWSADAQLARVTRST
jgi:hypothetical protein